MGLGIGRYVGIDVSSAHVNEARRRHSDCEFRVLNIHDESPGYISEFETVMMNALTEHVFNLKHLGLNLVRAMRSGTGRTDNADAEQPFGNDVVHRIGAALKLFARSEADDHIVIFNRKRLELFASECGLFLGEHRRLQPERNQLAILRQPPEGSRKRTMR